MELLITGASRGIGRALTFAAAKEGHRVHALGRSEELLREMAEKGKDIRPMPIDLDPDHVEEGLRRALEQEGVERLDGVVHAAGVLEPGSFEGLDKEDWEKHLRVNLIGPALALKVLHPYLRKGELRHVVLIGSMAGYTGSEKYPGLSAYGAAKAALGSLGESLAEEWKGDGISVNTLALGAVDTEMFKKAFPGGEAPVTPARMGNYILAFLKEGGEVMTGKHLPVSLSSP